MSTTERALREALHDAIEEIEYWAAYAGPYFQAKHDLAGTISRLQGILHDATMAALANPPSAERQAVPETPEFYVGQRVLVPGIVEDVYDSGRLGSPRPRVSVTLTKFSTIVFDRSEVVASLPPTPERTEPSAKAIEALCNDDPDLSVGEATEILRGGTEP